MRKKELTDKQRKDNKSKLNKQYYGTVQHAKAMVKYWTNKLEKLEQSQNDK